MGLEGHPDATNPGEQVDEAEVAVVPADQVRQRQQPLADGVGGVRRGLGLPDLPAPQGTDVDADRLGQLPLVVTATKGGQELADVLHGNLGGGTECGQYVRLPSHWARTATHRTRRRLHG
jgi:hypothetical protein